MSKTNFAKIIAYLVLLACVPAHAQTIDELTEAARKKKMAELHKASFSNTNEINLGIPTPVPSVKSNNHRDLMMLSIYGVGKDLVTEIVDEGTVGKYTVGDKTPSGWTVASIGKRSVTLKKASKGKETETRTLSFWAPVDTHTSQVKDGTGIAGSNPPLPPMMIGR